MPDYGPILNALLNDLAVFCALALFCGILNLIPTMVVAFIAAARTDTNLWSEMSRGMVWSWLTGVLIWASSAVLLSWLADMLLGQGTSTSSQVDRIVSFALIAFVFAIGVQYLLVMHYYRSQVQDRVGWEIEPRFRPVKRYFSFSLKTLLIVQIVLIVLLGMWVGARRDSIRQEYEDRRVANP